MTDVLDRLRFYKPDHREFCGVIYPSEFNTVAPSGICIQKWASSQAFNNKRMMGLKGRDK